MLKTREITFNNKSLSEFGFYLKKDIPVIQIAKKEFKTVTIPGSITGDSITTEGTFRNVERKYEFRTIPSKIPYNGDEEKFLKLFISWAQNNRDSYYQFFDSAKPGCYCLAVLTDVSDFKRLYKGIFDVTLTFSCQPYWHKNEGAKAITVNQPSSGQFHKILFNPESVTAYPLISVTAPNKDYGFRLVIANSKYGDSSLTVSSMGEYGTTLDIDSEIMQTMYNGYPQNELVSGTEYPKLYEGENDIGLFPTDGTGWSMVIYPRWRCL